MSVISDHYARQRRILAGFTLGILFGFVVICILVLAASLGRAASESPDEAMPNEAGVMIIPPSPFCIPAEIPFIVMIMASSTAVEMTCSHLPASVWASAHDSPSRSVRKRSA